MQEKDQSNLNPEKPLKRFVRRFLGRRGLEAVSVQPVEEQPSLQEKENTYFSEVSDEESLLPDAKSTLYSQEELDKLKTELEDIIKNSEPEEVLFGVRMPREYHVAERKLMAMEKDPPLLILSPEHPIAVRELERVFSQLVQDFSVVERTKAFSIGEEEREVSKQKLNALPFVKRENILYKNRRLGMIMVEGKIEVPLNAIASISSSTSFAGRDGGEGEKAGDTGRSTSIDVIRDYANRGKYTGESGLLDLTVCRLSDGGYCFDAESAHRVAAAKLRGEQTIIVDTINIYDDADSPLAVK